MVLHSPAKFLDKLYLFDQIYFSISQPFQALRHLSTEYFASSAVEHPGALLQTSDLQQCVVVVFLDSSGFLCGVLPWTVIMFLV